MRSTAPIVQWQSFTGPFDLLLQLARAKKIDSTSVSLGEISDAFIQRIAQTHVEPTVKAQFLIVAATLLLFKLRQVLPSLPLEEEEEIADLTRRLRIYQRYRQAGDKLLTVWQHQPLFSGPEHLGRNNWPLTLTANQVKEAMTRLVINQPPSATVRQHLRPRRLSLSECYTLVTRRLRYLKAASFDQLTPQTDAYTRAVTLLTILELHRQGNVQCEQLMPFATITVTTV